MLEFQHEFTDWIRGHLSLSTKRKIAFLRLRSRQWNSGLRVLPDFLIIGAQRSGTSSLYKYLGRHPQVVPSVRKEVGYFSTSFALGDSWYRSHFPLAMRRSLAENFGRGKWTFEATPDYLLHPLAPARAWGLLPDARLVVLVRDPVARAWSQYHHNLALKLEPLDFEEALDRETERLADETDRLTLDPNYPAKPLLRYSYVTRGLYADQLSRWLEHYPQSHLLVIHSKDLFARTGDVLERIQRFLNLPVWRASRFENYSRSKRPSSGPPPQLPDRLRARLRERFADPNRHLFQLVGEDFGWN